MTQKIYKVIYRLTPHNPWMETDIIARSEDHVKLSLEFGDEITHNQIEFKSIDFIQEYKDKINE